METRIIEVNGIKLEVDLRTATQISTYKIGDKVRVLVKQYTDYKSYPGIIVGFDNFTNRPTIIVAYIDASKYSGDPLQFSYINKDNIDTEIAPMLDDFIALDKSNILELMDMIHAKKLQELKEIENKKEYFLKYFNSYFEQINK
jgi:hypothetical protein